jgi:septal ring factor EnvC (AmiA/AmiB activator)
MAYYGDPASALAAQLRQLEEENVRLRNELMDAADEKFNLQATMATIEAEAQHKASQQVVGLQSELNFKVRGGVGAP